MTGLLFLIGQSVFAFSDTKGDPNADQIDSLQKQGILSGGSGHFRPNAKLTYAEGISMLVKGFDLKDDNVYIKEPKASDYYTKIKDNAWYAPAFIIAHADGLDVPKDVDPSAIMTREQFAHHLFKSIIYKRDIAFIELYMTFDDEAKVTPAYMDSIQKLLIGKIAALDGSNRFNPGSPITRSTAAGWLYNGIQFAKAHDEANNGGEKPGEAYDMKLTVTPVNAKVNEVTVTATVPHPGYGIRIASIAFDGSKAFVNVEIVQPDPDRMYPQVITDVTAVTYVSSAYQPELAYPVNGGSSSSSAGTAASSADASQPVQSTSAAAR